MAKFYGKIGFAERATLRPSVTVPTIVERYYAGDLVKNYAKQKSQEAAVDDFTFDNDISIVADPYAMNHFSTMRYVEFMGTRWKVQGVTVEYPRLRISFGGVYDGPTPTA